MPEPQPAPAESARFGQRVYRGTVAELSESAIRAWLALPWDLLILRIPAHLLHWTPVMARLAGPEVAIIPADVLMVYYLDLQAVVQPPLRNPLRFERLVQPDHPPLAGLISQIFDQYPTHYRANPALAEQAIREGYLAWAQAHHNGQPGACTWLAYLDDELAGLAACSFDASTGDCEGDLYGVDPGFRNRGLYADLLRYTASQFRQQGFRRLRGQTHVQNIPVQRALVKAGFQLSETLATVHLQRPIASLAANT